jgi:hypothetical protein
MPVTPEPDIVVESTYFPDHDLLVTTLSKKVSLGDLAKALAAYDTESFSDTTNVVYDMRDIEVDFDASAIDSLEAMFGRRRRRGDGARTGLVTNSAVIRSMLATNYERHKPQTTWKYFEDLGSAVEWAKSGA